MKWLILLFTLLFSVPAYAASATPSNAEKVELNDETDDLGIYDIRPDFYYQKMEDLDDDEILRGIYSEVIGISDSLSGPGVATPSDADALEDEEDLSDGQEMFADAYALDPVPLAEDFEDTYVNVLRYDITFRGDDYILLIPPEYIDNLYIDSQGRLWNMSTSTVTGRIVDAQFNPIVDEGMLMYLTPCLGNNFSTINEYGSPNYMRTYYWSGSRLTYNTTYGVITVNKYYNPFYVSQTLDYILLFVVVGGVLFLWLNNFKRY